MQSSVAPAPTEQGEGIGGRRRRDLGATLRWLLAFVTAGTLTVFAVLLVTGSYANEGPILVRVTDGHGVHLGDVFVLTGWAVAMLSQLGLVVIRRR